MSTYGRNFEFRVQPHQGQRAARYINPADGDAIVIGAPVAVITADQLDADERLNVQLVSTANANVPAVPVSGIHGIAIYEHAPNAFSGDDPLLVTFSDKDTVPVGEPCYLVSGDQVKVVLRNTNDNNFFGQRTYAGRTMVDEAAGATPNVNVGDYLMPHTTPSDSNGYWTKTATLSEAWLVVTAVNDDRGEVEARFLF